MSRAAHGGRLLKEYGVIATLVAIALILAFHFLPLEAL
jgi:hypothetical protein